jgi:RNA polymerase sigma-70 factor (ECF subfamily)
MIAFLMAIEDEITRNKLEDIYRLHRKKLWYVANDILHDEYEAEDAVQEALIKVSEYIDKNFDVKCNKTVGLVVIIVRRLSINIYNKRKRRKNVEVDSFENVADDDGWSPEIHVLRLDEKEWIAEKLADIKKKYADILTLKYFYEYSNRDIADMLSTSEGNVRIRLMRAKNALHTIIGDEYYEETAGK